MANPPVYRPAAGAGSMGSTRLSVVFRPEDKNLGRPFQGVELGSLATA
jgi:hypothetical protein